MATATRQPTWGLNSLQPSHMSHHYQPLPPRITDINPQESSPLYSGRLPPEIRNLIFEFALSETISTGIWMPSTSFSPPPAIAVPRYSGMKLLQTYPTLQAPVSLHFPFPPTTVNGVYPTNTDYTRPGYTGVKKVHTSLLRTCKRAYLETHHLPFTTKEHLFWHDAGPPNLKFPDERGYFHRFRADQLALVKHWHIFTHQSWLERSFRHASRFRVLQGIEQLTITLRHSDWWDHEHNAPLRIAPHHQDNTYESTLATRQQYADGEPVTWDPLAWGAAFSEMAALRHLAIEMECPEYKKAELDAIVLQAQQWRFPMPDGCELSAEGLPVSTAYWRAPKSRWTRRCASCEGNDGDCKWCAEKAALLAQGMGPRMVVVTVRWRRVRTETDEWFVVPPA